MLRFLLVVSFLSGTVLHAQDSTIRYQRSAAVILKLAPLWLLDADPAVAGGLEVRTGQRTSIQGEFGYGGPGWGRVINSSYQHAGTWRVKTELRFYRNRYRVNLRKNINVSATYPLGNYGAIEAYAKVLNVKHDWYAYGTNGMPPVSGGLSLDARHTLIRRNSLSLTAKVGRQFGWDDNRHQSRARLLWDVYIGAGIRLINQTNDGDPPGPGYSDPDRYIYNRFSNTGFRVAPTLAAGLKLGFAL